MTNKLHKELDSILKKRQNKTRLFKGLYRNKRVEQTQPNPNANYSVACINNEIITKYTGVSFRESLGLIMLSEQVTLLRNTCFNMEQAREKVSELGLTWEEETYILENLNLGNY